MTLPNIDRQIAIRRVLVDHLAGRMPNSEFMRAIPGLLDGLAPHMRIGAPAPAIPTARPSGDAVRPAVNGRLLDILRCLAHGHTYTETAEELGIAKGTVNTHCYRLYDELHARNAAHAVAIGYQTGLLP